MPKTNDKGSIILWVSRFISISALLSIVVLLMAQSEDKGKMLKDIEHNDERNTKLELRMELRDVKFDTFLAKQTKQNTIDSMNTAVLMKFLDKQIEFNEEVKEHIIKNE